VARATLAALALAKGIPPKLLAKVATEDERGVIFAYKDLDGTPARSHVRHNLESAQPSSWANDGSKIVAFGSHLIAHWHGKGEAILTCAEGDTDTLSGWVAQVPTIGIPGWSMYKLVTRAHVDPFAEFHIAFDNDAAGERGVAQMAKHLREIGYTGTIRRLSPVPYKDLTEWRLACNGTFADELVARRVQAPEVVIPAGPVRKKNGDRSEITLRCLASVEPEEVEYLWQDRIAFGKVTLCVGDPGGGKSYATVAIAAAATLGNRLPGDLRARCAPLEVFLCNYEDGAADTIRPRADAVGADVSRIHLLEGQRDDTGHVRPFGLADIPALIRELERRPQVRVLIIDPLGSVLANVDTHRDADVRVALQPLFDLADQRKIAVIVVAHLNKTQAVRSIYRVGGSIGFTGAARSVLLFGEEPESHRRGIVQIKTNVGPLAPPVEYVIDAGGFRFLGIAPELDAGRLLAAEKRPEDAERKSEVDCAKAWFLDQLQDNEVLAAEVERQAVKANISEATLRRARKALGVISHPHAVRGVRYLRLPGSSCLAQKSRDAQDSVLSETGNLSES
jgi:putative DNA primase/helicase